MLPGFRAMARYNRWMNERIYGHCENLSDAERKTDRGAFFRSVHGTLNHLLLGDRLWLGRFLAREDRRRDPRMGGDSGRKAPRRTPEVP